jgi:hypothetical protein
MALTWAKWTVPAIAVVTALNSFEIPGIPVGIVPAAAQTSPALSDAQDVNGAPGVVAEIVQCKRGDGVLSIRMRLRNTGDADTAFDVFHGNDYDAFYVTAGNKKYFVLRDTEKKPLATPLNGGYPANLHVSIPKGGSFIWYAKYPAPPDTAKKVIYYTPLTPPFEDIPVSD